MISMSDNNDFNVDLFKAHPGYVELSGRRTEKTIGGKKYKICIIKHKDGDLGIGRRILEGFGLTLLTILTLGLALLSNYISDSWRATLDGKSFKYIKTSITETDKKTFKVAADAAANNPETNAHDLLPPSIFPDQLGLDQIQDIEIANKKLNPQLNIDPVLRLQMQTIFAGDPGLSETVKRLKQLPLQEQLEKLRELQIKFLEDRNLAIGPGKWDRHIGKVVGKVPGLPPNINQILDSEDPFNAGKKVKETHILVFVPCAVVNKNNMHIPITLQSLGELVNDPKTGHTTKYSHFFAGEHNTTPVQESHWVLMTKDVIPGSENLKYDDRVKLVEEGSKKAGVEYQVPNAIDVAACILLNFVISGKCIYSLRSYSRTHCQEKCEGKYPLIVGWFAADGLDVSIDYYGSHIYGVGASRVLRKF